MKKREILIAPEGCKDWLTAFNEYTPLSGKGRFSIVDDQGDIIECDMKKCPHLNGQDWIIKSEAEKEWNELNGFIELTDEQAKRKEYLIKVLKK